MDRRRFRKWLADNLPGLPDEFVEWLRANDLHVGSLSEIVERFEEWQRLKGLR